MSENKKLEEILNEIFKERNGEYTFSIFDSVEKREIFCKAFSEELVKKGVTVKE